MTKRLLMCVCAMVSLAANAMAQDVSVSANDAATSLGMGITSRTPWQGVRLRIPGHLVEIRDMIRHGGDSIALEMMLRNLEEDLNEYHVLAESMAFEEFDQITETKHRIERLIDYLARDYDNGSNAQVMTTLRLLDESLVELEDLAFLADQREGRNDSQPGGLLPPDWGDLKYGNSASRTSWSVMNARELAERIRRRRALLDESSRRKLQAHDESIARELGELARALALRQTELPPLMREGFRNVALRIEVISENLIEYLRAEDRANYRRQLLLMEKALGDAERYLDLRNELSQEQTWR